MTNFTFPKSSPIFLPQAFELTSTFLILSLLPFHFSAKVHEAEEAGAAHMNGILLVSFVGAWYPRFSVSLNSGSLDIKPFLHWAHADAGVEKREIVAMLTEKRQHELKSSSGAGLSRMKIGCYESSIQSSCGSVWVCHCLVHVLSNMTSHFAVFVPPFQRWGCLGLVFEWAIVVPSGIEDYYRPDCIHQGLPWSVIVEFTLFESLIALHSLSVLNGLIKKKTVSAHMLPTTAAWLTWQFR